MRWSWERFREDVQGCPWFLVEALIGNVIVGALDYHAALWLGQAIAVKARRAQENVDGAGI